jgi:hypothetical protein
MWDSAFYREVGLIPALSPDSGPLGRLRAACPIGHGSVAIGPSQLAPGHLVEPGRELAVPLIPDMQAHPRGLGGRVAHLVHQLGQRGARLTSQRVTGTAEIVNVNLSRKGTKGRRAAGGWVCSLDLVQ